MARSPARIRTKVGRRLTGSCTKEQASRLMSAQKHPGAKKRDGRCTLQSAEYVLRFGAGTMFYAEPRRAAPRREARPKKEKFVDLVPWWKTFGFDEPTRRERSPKQLPARQRSAAEELGLSTGSKPTQQEVKAAFRRKALEVHPDRGGTSEDFRRAVHARDVLLSAAR